jgi:hypothetical protein
MKRMYLYMAGILVLIGLVYVWGHRGNLLRLLPGKSSSGLGLNNQPDQLEWKAVDESAQGFKLEMPGDPKQVVVQANNEAGLTEPISMLMVKPDSDHTYAIAWAEKPPVARMNDLVADKTLDQARDGSLARTETTAVSEIRTNPQGYPGRDVVSRNAGGGIMDTRFIYARPRLYMLIASSPSAAGRHEEEVIHFFNSFSIASNTQIPETLPASTE